MNGFVFESDTKKNKKILSILNSNQKYEMEKLTTRLNLFLIFNWWRLGDPEIVVCQSESNVVKPGQRWNDKRFWSKIYSTLVWHKQKYPAAGAESCRDGNKLQKFLWPDLKRKRCRDRVFWLVDIIKLFLFRFPLFILQRLLDWTIVVHNHPLSIRLMEFLSILPETVNLLLQPNDRKCLQSKLFLGENKFEFQAN